MFLLPSLCTAIVGPKITSDLLFTNNFKTIRPICTIHIPNCREKNYVTENFIFKDQLMGTIENGTKI